MNITVIGTRDHEGEMAGRAFDLLGVQPRYVAAISETERIADERPNVVIVSLEWTPEVRLAVAAARRAAIPVVYLMDGVLEWSFVWNNQSFVKPHGTMLQPLLASHLTVIGRHPARILAGLGLADRIRLIGLPRLDELGRVERIGRAEHPRVLVATARSYGHHVEHRVMVTRALRDLKLWFDAQSHVVPVWRIADELADVIGVEPERDEPVTSALTRSSGVISFTSTILLESMRLGVPTAQIEYRTVPMYVQTAWEIRHGDQIGGVVHDLLQPLPERLAYQDHCLDDELESGCASERLAGLIREAVEPPTGAISVPSRRDAPGWLDYRRTHSQLSAFAVSPLPVLQYELDAAYQYIAKLRQRVGDREWEIGEQRARIASLDERATAAERELTATRGQLSAVQASMADVRARRVASQLTRRRIRRVGVYGAGDIGRLLIRHLRHAGIEVVTVTDSNPACWRTTIEGVGVVPPADAVSCPIEAVVIGSFGNIRAIRRIVRRLYAGCQTPPGIYSAA